MTTIDLRRIKCANSLRSDARQAILVAEDALKPALSDMSLIGDIYRHFKDFLKQLSQPINSEKRREFLFIVAYLYCPSVLIGDSMPRGFRGVLKDILHVESPSAISNYTSDLMFLYNHYQDFREIVEGGFSYIVKSMGLDKDLSNN